MTIRSTDFLISRFETGDVPEGADFVDLIQTLSPNVVVVDTVQALRDLPPPDADPTVSLLAGSVVVTRGAKTVTDEGGQTWRWNPLSVAADDLATVACPTGRVVAGRWEAILGPVIRPEWWGMLNDENAAYAINAALHYAWANGYPLVRFKRARHGLRLWGVILVSNVTLDLCGSALKPYVPSVPPDGLSWCALSIFGHGDVVRVPEDMVALYNLRSELIVNQMIDDPSMVIDYRALHPAYSGGGNGNYFIEFKPGLVFDPRDNVAQTNGVSSLVPGDRVWLIRPWYETAVNQALAAPNIVDHVSGETVYFREALSKPFARHHCNNTDTGSQTAWGGIGLCPPNFMLENSHVINFTLDCSEVDRSVYAITPWRAGMGLNCELGNFEIIGGEYQWGIFPRGRDNWIHDGIIQGFGKLMANEQGNTLNRFERLRVLLASWQTEGQSTTANPLHFAERMSIILDQVEFVCPPIDQYTPDASGAYLTTGSVGNSITNCRFVNYPDTLCSIGQIDGYGNLVYKDNEIVGDAIGQLIDIGRQDTSYAEAAPQMPAVEITGNEWDVTSADPALGLANLARMLAFASVDGTISGNFMSVKDFSSGAEIEYGTYGLWSLQYPGVDSGDIAADTVQHIRDGFFADGNQGIPALRWLRFDIGQIVTTATVDAVNNRITLPDGADTAFSIFINEPDLPMVSLIARLTVSDASGVGGAAFFRGRLSMAEADAPQTPLLSVNKPAATEVAIAAETTKQQIVLPLVRSGAVGYVPKGAWELTLVGTNPSDTVGALYLHAIDVLVISGR